MTTDSTFITDPLLLKPPDPLTPQEEDMVSNLTAAEFPSAASGRPPGYAVAGNRPLGAPEPALPAPFARLGFTSGPATPSVLRQEPPIQRPTGPLEFGRVSKAIGDFGLSAAQSAFTAFTDPTGFLQGTESVLSPDAVGLDRARSPAGRIGASSMSVLGNILSPQPSGNDFLDALSMGVPSGAVIQAEQSIAAGLRVALSAGVAGFKADVGLGLAQGAERARAPVLPSIGGGAGGPLPIILDLPSFESAVEVNTRPNLGRSLARVPGFRPAIRIVGGRSAVTPALAETGEDIINQANVGRLAQEVSAQAHVNGATRVLSSMGTTESLFGKFDPETMIFQEGQFKGMSVAALNDIAANTQKLTQLLPEQQAFLRHVGALDNAAVPMLKAHGIDVAMTDIEQNSVFLSRKWLAKVDAKTGEVIETASVGGGPARIGGKAGFEKSRIFKTAQEAADAGFIPLTPEAAVQVKLQATFRRIINKDYGDFVLNGLGPDGWRSIAADEDALAAQALARTQLDRARGLVDTIQKAGRGYRPTLGTIRAVTQNAEDLRAGLTDAGRVKVDEFLKLAATMNQPGAAQPTLPKGFMAVSRAGLRMAGSDRKAAAQGMAAEVRALVTRAQEMGIGEAHYEELGKLNKVIDRMGRGERVPGGEITRLAGLMPPIQAELRGSQTNLVDLVKSVAALNQMPLVPFRAPRGFIAVAPGTVREMGKVQQAALTEMLPAARARVKTYQDAFAQAQSLATDAKDLARRTAFDEASLPEHPAFAGKIFIGAKGREATQTLRQLTEMERQFGPLKALNDYNAIFRFLGLAIDLSLGFIQHMALLLYRPGIWGESFVNSVKTLFDDKVFANFMADPGHNWSVQQSRNLIMSGRGAFEASEAATGPVTRIPVVGKLIGKAIQPFERAYETGLDTAAVLLREALVKPGMTDNEVNQLENFINVFSGQMSSQKLGISRNQQLMEATVLLAPRYFRASAIIMKQMLTPTADYNMVRIAMAKGATAALLTWVALDGSLAEIRGQSYKDWQESLWRRIKAGDFTTEIAGQKVGLGTKYMSMGMAITRSITDPASLLKLSNENPGLRFVNNQMASLGQDVEAIVTKHDYQGLPTMDTPLHFAQRVVADDITPLWATAALQKGDASSRAAATGSQFFGLRGYPLGKTATLDQFVDGLSVDSQGRAVPFDQRIHSWADLEPKAMAKLRQGQEVQAIEDRFAKDKTADRLREERRKVFSQQQADDQDVHASTITPKEWRDQYYNRQLTKGVISDTVELLGLNKPQKDLSPEQLAAKGYVDLRNTFTDKRTGRFNTDGWEKASTDYLAKLPSEQSAYITRNLHPNTTPYVEDFEKLKVALKQANYYDLYKQNPDYQSRPWLRTLYDSWLETKGNEVDIGKWQAAHSEAEMRSVRKLEGLIDEQKGRYLLAHPALDAGLAVYYGHNPVGAPAKAAVLKAFPGEPLRVLTYGVGGERIGADISKLSVARVTTLEQVAALGDDGMTRILGYRAKGMADQARRILAALRENQ